MNILFSRAAWHYIYIISLCTIQSKSLSVFMCLLVRPFTVMKFHSPSFHVGFLLVILNISLFFQRDRRKSSKNDIRMLNGLFLLTKILIICFCQYLRIHNKCFSFTHGCAIQTIIGLYPNLLMFICHILIYLFIQT